MNIKKSNFQMQIGPNTIEITELPVRKWTQDYKEFLDTLLRPQDKVFIGAWV